MDLGQGLVLALSEWFLVPSWEGAAHATRAEPAARGHAGGGRRNLAALSLALTLPQTVQGAPFCPFSLANSQQPRSPRSLPGLPLGHAEGTRVLKSTSSPFPGKGI